jgi:hypothetical protein
MVGYCFVPWVQWSLSGFSEVESWSPMGWGSLLAEDADRSHRAAAWFAELRVSTAPAWVDRRLIPERRTIAHRGRYVLAGSYHANRSGESGQG